MKSNYRTPDVCKALLDAGIVRGNKSAAKVFFYRKIREGSVVYPNLGNPHSSYRKYTKEMVDDIVKAFSAGGSGRWSIEDYKDKE